MHHTILLGATSGFLVALAYYLPNGWPLVFISLVPLLFAIKNAQSWKGALLAGLVCGAVIVGATTFWMFAAKPLPKNFTLSPFVSFASVFMSWFLIMVFTAPFVGVWASLVQRFSLWSAKKILVAAALWVLIVEWARMYGFAAITYAPGVANPPFWTTGALGYPLADNLSWVQFASFGGIWMLDFIAAGFSCLFFVFLMLRTKKLRIVGIATTAGFILLLSLLPFADMRAAFSRRPDTSVSVGHMTLYASAVEQLAAIQEAHTDALRLTNDLLHEEPTILLLPEGEDFLSFKNVITASTTIIVAAAPSSGEDGRKLLRGYATELPSKATHTLRNKMILTPQGEYLIAVFRYGLPLLGLSHAVDAFADTKTLATGSWGEPLLINNVRASLMFCFEVFGADFGSMLVAHHDANVMLAMISHERFRSSGALDADTFRFFRVRTMEAGVSSILSTNHTPSYALDRYGRILDSLGVDYHSEGRVVSLPVWLSTAHQ